MAHKDPVYLVNLEKPHEVIAHACGECGLVVGSVKEHGVKSAEVARTHCGPWTCEKCGAEHERRYQSTCDKCWRENLAKKQAEREAEMFEKAVKVPVNKSFHDGPVYWEGVGHNDGFFGSVDELLDWCECEELDPPKYVWPCIVIHPHLRFEDLVEQALNDHHESVELVAEVHLRDFLEQWNEKQTGESWEPTHSRVLLLESDEAD